ncbi:hypothetical protein LshimejAT787_1002090 [Lyophyllum shimeji]|uniref:Uncharacterized protein n=1 Tax=Lyophyllum shimeji TaxID=47721 RepID=A0A9P3PU73_LYOSH|nr:hypothetical protein LshimejAT787_1002090 [Lyophyllum shimeji]
MRTNGTTSDSATRGANARAESPVPDVSNFEDDLNNVLNPGVIAQNEEVSAELKKYIGPLGQDDSWHTWVKLGDEHMRAGVGRLLAQRLRGAPPEILEIVTGILTTPKIVRRIEEEVSPDLPQGSLSVLFREYSLKHEVDALPQLADQVFGRAVTPLFAMFVEVSPAV